ncbi:hypothetical protein V6Z11_A10G131500 [Gossypium hirsutum]
MLTSEEEKDEGRMKGMSLKVGRKLWFCGEKLEILLRGDEKKKATNNCR